MVTLLKLCSLCVLFSIMLSLGVVFIFVAARALLYSTVLFVVLTLLKFAFNN